MIDRKSIYYWKCDRPHAFYALQESSQKTIPVNYGDEVTALLSGYFGSNEFTFRHAGGQGNHITYQVFFKGGTYFLRIEDGPEGDNYMGIEAEVMGEVRKNGVNTPEVFAVDASRAVIPFAYQIMEFIDFPDLNSIHKKEKLNPEIIGKQIGESIARWQAIKPCGFGPFDPFSLNTENKLMGLHANYQDYFLLNWDRHLDFLEDRRFLSETEKDNLKNIVESYVPYLHLAQGCLVHKDLALWNILGSKDKINAFIDWDDSICGDPTDDLSLLACFHDWKFMVSVLQGYQKVRELPDHFESCFWLHLLRNMIVKAVIRVGAGYFDRHDDFFLIGSGSDGRTLEIITRERIQLAYSGLTGDAKLTDL
ncbi:MAG: phosphotransferase family protein [Mangrovibacterium sp.]